MGFIDITCSKPTPFRRSLEQKVISTTPIKLNFTYKVSFSALFKKFQGLKNLKERFFKLCIYIFMYMCIYLYTYREREREKGGKLGITAPTTKNNLKTGTAFQFCLKKYLQPTELSAMKRQESHFLHSKLLGHTKPNAPIGAWKCNFPLFQEIMSRAFINFNDWCLG